MSANNTRGHAMYLPDAARPAEQQSFTSANANMLCPSPQDSRSDQLFSDEDLNHHRAAGDIEHNAGNPSRVVSNKIEHSGCHVLGGSKAPDRMVVAHRILLRLRDPRLVAIRQNCFRSDTIRADPIGSNLRSHALTKARAEPPALRRPANGS
jgi:hypothetical protein